MAPEPVLDPEELRATFKRRYGNFRSLLTANNNALQAMAELEKIYYSGDTYRMAVIRSKVTAILVNVYKMIRNLLEMSDGRYQDLETIFERIGHDSGNYLRTEINVSGGAIYSVPCRNIKTTKGSDRGEDGQSRRGWATSPVA